MNSVAIKGAGLLLSISFPPVEGNSFKSLITNNKVKVYYYSANDTANKFLLSNSNLLGAENDNTYIANIPTESLKEGMLMILVNVEIASGDFPRNEIARCSSGVLICN